GGSPPTCAARVDQSPSASPGIAYTLAAHLGPGTPQAWRPGSARGQRGADALDVHRVEVRGPPGGAVVLVDDDGADPFDEVGAGRDPLAQGRLVVQARAQGRGRGPGAKPLDGGDARGGAEAAARPRQLDGGDDRGGALRANHPERGRRPLVLLPGFDRGDHVLRGLAGERVDDAIDVLLDRGLPRLRAVEPEALEGGVQPVLADRG